jgi:hypothetical protein
MRYALASVKQRTMGPQINHDEIIAQQLKVIPTFNVIA